jgi:hypothetical protein
MDETGRRRISLASEVALWSVELRTVLGGIHAASKRVDLPGRQKLDLEVTGRRINSLFKAIAKAIPDADEREDDALLEEFIQNTDRLRELITSANVALDTISKLPLDRQTPAARTRDWRTSFVNRPKR